MRLATIFLLKNISITLASCSNDVIVKPENSLGTNRNDLENPSLTM